MSSAIIPHLQVNIFNDILTEIGIKAVQGLALSINATHSNGWQVKAKNICSAYELCHTQKNEQIREVKSTGYDCDLCAYETMDKWNYERHIRTEQHRKKKERKAKAGIHCSKDFNFGKPNLQIFSYFNEKENYFFEITQTGDHKNERKPREFHTHFSRRGFPTNI